MSAPTYSIVIPVKDEEGNLPELHRRLTSLLESLDGAAEVILVDDGSRDSSYAIMLDLHQFDPRFKIVRLSRNFGHQLAITAGVDLASGDAIIIMDADLQHPPEVIPELIARWREGYDIAYGVMQERTESWFKRATARWYYRMLRAITEVDVPEAAGDFRLVDRRALDAFTAMRERNRYVRGMFSWIGYRQIGVPYVCPPRFAGTSKYSLRKMLGLARVGILSFSNVPLKLALRAGFIVSGLSMAFGISAIAARLSGVGVPGWASIAVVTSFLGGFQLVLIGVIAEYVGEIYDEVKRRPLYLVRDALGFERDAAKALREHATLGDPDH
jgi:polyisoprenyl-phosphate glycosyltransferase